MGVPAVLLGHTMTGIAIVLLLCALFAVLVLALVQMKVEQLQQMASLRLAHMKRKPQEPVVLATGSDAMARTTNLRRRRPSKKRSKLTAWFFMGKDTGADAGPYELDDSFWLEPACEAAGGVGSKPSEAEESEPFELTDDFWRDPPVTMTATKLER